jgi:NTE family protein
VLKALATSVGWDARDASLVLGTSAGAQVAALLRAGMNGDDLARRAAGQPLRPAAAAIAEHWVRPDHRAARARRKRAPAALGYLATALRRPWTLRPGRLVSALLPEGGVCLDVQARGLRRLFGEHWPERELWITAVHLDSGERVTFGAKNAPPIDVGTAVACSGAVPGVCTPIAWQGRRYVDGGVASATHLDLLRDQAFDMIVVSSPLSMFTPMRALLWRELRNLGRRTPVTVFEPRGAALRTMGLNPMATERAPAVVHAAFESTLRDLESPEKMAFRRMLSA